MPQPCPLGSGLGKAEKAKVAPILPNLTSKRDNFQLPGLTLKTAFWLGRQTGVFPPMYSNLKHRQLWTVCTNVFLCWEYTHIKSSLWAN